MSPPLTALPADTKYISEVSDRQFRYGSMFFDASLLQHINCGRFYKSNRSYSHCFWEAWVKPSASLAAAGYIVADTNGGAHNTLWGMQPSDAGQVVVTANMHDGTTLTTFSPTERIPMGYWSHVAIGYDGSHLMTWVNGVLSYVVEYAPAQRKNTGGNDATLFIGGSDHNNFWGNIGWVRGFEGYGRCRELSDFSPEAFPRTVNHYAGGDANIDVPQFLMSFLSPDRAFTDYGQFEGVSHHGVQEALQSTVLSPNGSGSFIGTGLSLPSFIAGVIDADSYIPTAPTTPSGAIIFDSFSRVNRGMVNPTNKNDGTFTLGAVEVGSVNWTQPDGSADAGGAGVNNGKAFIYYGAGDKVVQTSTQNVDVRVDRLVDVNAWAGLIVRYKDANDYYRITGTDTSIVVDKYESGVHTTTSYTPTGGWKTLRVTALGTTLTVYTGTATEGTFTSQGSFTCTNVTGATKAGITRDALQKRPFVMDNFLVK